MKLKKYLFHIFFSIILFITFYVYKEGLFGGFIFDDNINLQNINVFANSKGIDAFIRYIMSYESGFLKRPITTLSFLFNATSWPANPFPFKFMNLLIHLFNGILLYIVSKKILTLLISDGKGVQLAATLNMAIWLTHPFFVSTTLYVIQRMAMLPVTFVLIGIYFYIVGREVVQHNKLRGYLFLTFSVYVCTSLAVLSKENGIILPFILLLLESLVIVKKFPRLGRNLKNLLLIIPIIVIVIVFIIKAPEILKGYTYREFTLVERLLTQPRILFHYLYHLFIPNYLTAGVFVDGFNTSTSLIKPITTLLSITSLSLMTIVAIVIRKKYTVISFALLFFLLTHILESTFIPLEMYFEHRNYLPSLFLFLPVSYYLARHLTKYHINYILMFFIVFYLAYLTYLRSDLWNNNAKMVNTLVGKFPQSIRLIDQYILNQYSEGNTLDAIKTLEDTIINHKDIMFRLNLLNLNCSINHATSEDFDRVIDYINRVKITSSDLPSIAGILRVLIQEKCVENNSEVALSLIKAVKLNKGYNKNISSIIDFDEAMIILKLEKYNEALGLFENYLTQYLAFDDIIYIIDLFIENKKYQHANQLLNLFEEKYRQQNNFFLKREYVKDIERLKYIINPFIK